MVLEAEGLVYKRSETSLCQINRLSAEIAHLHSQLEKGGVVKQNLEYELAKVNKELAAERRQRLERDAATDETVKKLQSTLILVQLSVGQIQIAFVIKSLFERYFGNDSTVFGSDLT